jgi:arylsulfatase
MLSNTPLSLYKHFTHEGGLTSPLIVHYPKAAQKAGEWVSDPTALMDIVPTICELTGATYPRERAGHWVKPADGVSLAPTLHGEQLAERAIPFDHQGAWAMRKGDWKIVRGKRLGKKAEWELYNIANDRMEQHDLAREHPDIVKELAAEWLRWAKEVGIDLDITEGV